MGSNFGSECHKIDLQIPICSNSHLFAKNLQTFLKLPFTKMKPARKTKKKRFFVTLRISRSKNVQNAYPRFGPKMREDCLSDSLHQWTFAIPSQFVFLKGMCFGFDSATKIDPDWKHKSHNTNVRVNVVFHCVQWDLTVHWQRLQGATSFFSDQTHFLIMRIIMLFFFNVVTTKVNFSSMFSRNLAIWSHHNNKLSAKSFPFCVTASVLTLQIPICSNSHLFESVLYIRIVSKKKLEINWKCILDFQKIKW